MEDPHKADNEDYHGTDLLDDDGRVCDKWPEVVWLKPWVSLKVLEECFLVGVIIGIYEGQRMIWR